MRKKVCLLLLAGALIIGLTGCKEDNSGRYALIVNHVSEESLACTDEVWEGLQTYAQLNEMGCQRYTADGTERKDYAKAIEEAVGNGAKVVVCVGEELEVPVYEAQKDYDHIKFVLLNGEPHKRYSEKTNIGENTVGLQFNETQQGFVMGYMAVMNGYRYIGCMGGPETEESQKIVSGFIQGAEAACNDLGLISGDVRLRYTFTGEDKLSPVYMSQAMAWYEDGCEVIFALDEGIRLSVLEAAKNQSGWVLGTTEACVEESDKVITAAVVDYAGAVINQIELFETEAFAGGQILNCGVKEKGVSLITEDVGFSDNTMAQYQQMCKRFEEGTLTVEETAVIPAVSMLTLEKE